MNAADRAEMRQMLTDVLSGHTEEMKGRFNVLHANLVRIEEQTTKTNGRVTMLEKQMNQLELDESQHVMKCPNASRIKAMEDNEISRKAIMKFIVVGAAVAGGGGGLVFSILKFLLLKQ